MICRYEVTAREHFLSHSCHIKSSIRWKRTRARWVKVYWTQVDHAKTKIYPEAYKALLRASTFIYMQKGAVGPLTRPTFLHYKSGSSIHWLRLICNLNLFVCTHLFSTNLQAFICQFPCKYYSTPTYPRVYYFILHVIESATNILRERFSLIKFILGVQLQCWKTLSLAFLL